MTVFDATFWRHPGCSSGSGLSAEHSATQTTYICLKRSTFSSQADLRPVHTATTRLQLETICCHSDLFVCVWVHWVTGFVTGESRCLTPQSLHAGSVFARETRISEAWNSLEKIHKCLYLYILSDIPGKNGSCSHS